MHKHTHTHTNKVNVHKQTLKLNLGEKIESARNYSRLNNLEKKKKDRDKKFLFFNKQTVSINSGISSSSTD